MFYFFIKKINNVVKNIQIALKIGQNNQKLKVGQQNQILGHLGKIQISKIRRMIKT